MPEFPAAPLAAQLTDEYGDVVPAGLITTTVAAAWRAVPTHDDVEVREMARMDVAALADAVTRRGSAAPAA